MDKNHIVKLHALLKYMKSGRKITTYEAFVKFGITSLHRYLTVIRREYGLAIDGKWVKNEKTGDRFKIYRRA